MRTGVSALTITRWSSGVSKNATPVRIPRAWGGRGERVNALFFLAGCAEQPGRSLRLAGELAAFLHGKESAAAAVAEAAYETEVKEALLPDLSIGQYALLPELSTAALIGHSIGELTIDEGFDVEAIRRDGVVIRADTDTVLQADDQITLIGPKGQLPDFDDLTRLLNG